MESHKIRLGIIQFCITNSHKLSVWLSSACMRTPKRVLIQVIDLYTKNSIIQFYVINNQREVLWKLKT
jgi:hypothetical protein